MKILKKYMVIGIIISFVGASFLPTVTSNDIENKQSPLNSSIIWYVDANADCPGDGTKQSPFCRIEYALNIASASDTIRVFSGKYYENNLNVDISIKIIGNGSDNTIIDGGFSGTNIININSDGVELSGFGFINCGYNAVCVKRCIGGTIKNNAFYDVIVGINLDNSENIIISENDIDEFQWYGIWIYQSNSNDVLYNNITSTTGDLELFRNQQGSGILLWGSDRTTIKFNNIYKCNYGIYFHSSGFNDVEENDIQKNEVGFFVLMSFLNTVTKNNICSNAMMDLVAVFTFDWYPNNWWGNKLYGPVGRAFRILAGAVSIFPWSQQEHDL